MLVVQLGSESWTYDSDDTAPAIKLGIILDDTHRIYLKYGNYDGENSSEKCECGSSLIYQEGCLTCKNCGFSKCN